jgi:hypothetical protein
MLVATSPGDPFVPPSEHNVINHGGMHIGPGATVAHSLDIHPAWNQLGIDGLNSGSVKWGALRSRKPSNSNSESARSKPAGDYSHRQKGLVTAADAGWDYSD